MPRITPIHWKKLESVFLAAGFKFARQEGSHRSYIKPGISRPIVIPTYIEIPVSIIRNNLKTAGISRRVFPINGTEVGNSNLDSFVALLREASC